PTVKTFFYQAVSNDGRAVAGRARALDELDLDRELETRGLHLGRAKVLSGTHSRRKYRIPSDELLSLTTQLAVTTGAGVPLVQALESIAQRAASPEARELLQEIVLGLEQGQSLSEALEAHPRCFPLVYLASVRAGETS